MIKDNLIFTGFYLVLGGIHYLLLPKLPAMAHKNDFLLVYICLLAISVMGNTLFYFRRKLDLMNFASMFMIFTTIQLLACMSFALAIKLMRGDEATNSAIHFVVVFLITLTFQSIYLVKKQQKEALD